MYPAHIYPRLPHLIYVLPLRPLYTLTQQEPKIDHAKTALGPTNAMQAAKQGAKEASRQQDLASKPRLPDITPTNWAVVIMLVKVK
jgi:hypothetical protein